MPVPGLDYCVEEVKTHKNPKQQKRGVRKMWVNETNIIVIFNGNLTKVCF